MEDDSVYIRDVTEKFLKAPSDELPFSVRVSCDEDVVHFRLLRFPPYTVDDALRIVGPVPWWFGQLVFGRRPHRLASLFMFSGRQVLNVAFAGADDVFLSEVLLDGLRLGL